jgi:hypothetical protein
MGGAGQMLMEQLLTMGAPPGTCQEFPKLYVLLTVMSGQV